MTMIFYMVLSNSTVSTIDLNSNIHMARALLETRAQTSEPPRNLASSPHAGESHPQRLSGRPRNFPIHQSRSLAIFSLLAHRLGI
jgi:hypothetical protein